jgi:hypothetical protein
MTPAPVDVLLLGSGWTSSFLLPLLHERRISHAYTSRTPRAGSEALTFAVSAEGAASRAAWQALPQARCVVIVFPLRSRAAAHAIVESYELAHGATNWIALGSTGAWGSGACRGAPETALHTHGRRPQRVTSRRRAPLTPRMGGPWQSPPCWTSTARTAGRSSC